MNKFNRSGKNQRVVMQYLFENGPALGLKVAHEIGVAPSVLDSILDSLRARGMVAYGHGDLVELTPAGRKFTEKENSYRD